MSYQDFLTRRRQANDADGFEPTYLPDWMFGFQRRLTGWSVLMGRSAQFQDCGMGKTPQELVWAENVKRHTGRPVLVIAPLAVSWQTAAEAEKFGLDAAVSRDGSKRSLAGITVTNYERLERFDTNDFGGVVCDESSCIKAFDGKRRALVTEFLRPHRYRSLWTATAAPNDYTELGTSSEALGRLGHTDMLTRFFTNKLGNVSTGRGYKGSANAWRFKGHGEDPFWRWVASWARAVRRPSDLGFPDGGFELPPLVEREHVVGPGEAPPPEDRLFDVPANGLREEREEIRRTLGARCERAAAALEDAETCVAWCHLNDESALLARLIPGAVEVRGSDRPDDKEEKLLAFTRGDANTRALVTKPTIAGWGLNWQRHHRMSYFPSHSYEAYYQAVRRMLRFGQENAVEVDAVTTPGGAKALENLRRKAAQADRMFDRLVAHTREAADLRRDDSHDQRLEVPAWLAS